MHLSERQTEILRRARALGRVDVESLAADFDVSTQTIRRDLNDLSQSGLLARVHGGAVVTARVSNVAYAERRVVSAPEKRAIGTCAARMIPDGCSVFLNIGTTTEEVARGLTDHHDLVVITNNLNVVGILSGSPGKDIILAGGIVRQADGAIVGDDTVEFIRKFKADFAFIGASALDEDGAIMDYDMREVAVTRAIVANARRTVLVCDRLKFERTAPMRICSVADIHAFVTDAEPPEAFAEVCTRVGTTIEIAAPDDLGGGAD
jgi:DeoR family transcriptional regulator, glycerol-3-phosphate regulon repressor